MPLSVVDALVDCIGVLAAAVVASAAGVNVVNVLPVTVYMLSLTLNMLIVCVTVVASAEVVLPATVTGFPVTVIVMVVSI
jgi:hypothetical protein